MGKCIESILVYGQSGAGKTTQASEFARYVKDKTGKRTRLASCSGGGWCVIQPEVDSGLIEPLWIPGYPDLIYAMHMVAQGYWPDKTGKLVPGDWSQVGGLVFDSLTEAADQCMKYGLDREANQRSFKLAAQDASHIFEDGPEREEVRFGVAAKGHYGAVQALITKWVINMKRLGGIYVMCTALEKKGEEDVGKVTVYGPDGIGKALTPKLPAMFDRTVRVSVSRNQKGAAERRMYLVNHWEGSDPVVYLANARLHWKSKFPAFLAGDDVSLYNLFQMAHGGK